MWDMAAWYIEHWYLLALFCLALFAYGFYRNWQREKRRAKLEDADLSTALGDRPGAGGSLESYADAELPAERAKRPPADRP